MALGNSETISVDVNDLSGVSVVYLEYDGVNHTMIPIDADTWENNTWTPSSVGVKSYTIWANDSEGNWAHLDGQILVNDLNAPTIKDIIESADPLEYGLTETITVNVTDDDNVHTVFLEYDNLNHSMSYIGDGIYSYTLWLPDAVGSHAYKIWANDTNGNLNVVLGDILVEDTIAPFFGEIVEVPDPVEFNGLVIINVTVTDLSDIISVLLEFDNANHSMSEVSPNIWEYDTWTPDQAGTNAYTIWAIDSEGNINSTSGSIFVNEEPIPQIIITDPVNETIFTSAFDIPLEFETAHAEFDTFWVEYNNNGIWISIAGNGTVDLYLTGEVDVRVRGQTEENINYTSNPVKIYIVITNDPSVALLITMAKESGVEFVAGTPIELTITVENVGDVDISHIVMYFTWDTKEYRYNYQNPVHIQNLQTGASYTFKITIIPKVEISPTVTGTIIADQYSAMFNLKIEENEDNIMMYVGWSLGGVGGVATVAYGGKAIKKLKLKKGSKFDKKHEPKFKKDDPGDFGDVEFEL